MDVSPLMFAIAILAQNDSLPPATLPSALPASSPLQPTPITATEGVDLTGPGNVDAAGPGNVDVAAPGNVDAAAPGNVDAAAPGYGDATSDANLQDTPRPARLVPVQPADLTSPAEGRPAAIPAAHKLFGRFSSLPAHAQLEGEPIALVEVLGPHRLARQQMAAATAYWNLSGAVAVYCLCNEELEQLEQWAISGSLSAIEQAQWEATLTATLAEIQQCRIDVLTGQQTLIAMTDSALNRRLPLPSDIPHTGSYQTRINKLVSTAVVPRQMQVAAQFLPVRQQTIQLREAAVDAALAAHQATSRQYAAGGSPVAALWATHDLLAAQRRALITAIVDYNLAIAAYALPLAPQGTSSARLVTMLIKRPATNSTVPSPRPALVAEQPSVEQSSVEQPSEVQPTTLIVPEVPAEPTVAPPLTAPAAAPQPRPPLPSIDRPVDLPGAAPPLRRTGEPTLAPPLEIEPYQPTEEDAPAPTSPDPPGAGQPTPADPPNADSTPR